MKWVIASILVLLSAPALAGPKFAAFESRDAVAEGRGGTKTIVDGIDFWLTGTPPRKIRIVGMITDTRKDKMLSGNALESKAVARLVRENGGDAAIVLKRDKQFAGMESTANLMRDENFAFGSSSGRAVHEITTTFAVVKYIDQ